jgi:hypothetical protein
MDSARRPFPLLLLAVALAALLLACGGRSQGPSGDLGVDSGDGGACAPVPCPSNLPWDPVTCSCGGGSTVDGGSLPIDVDATAGGCSGARCPDGYVLTMLGAQCACVPHSVPAGGEGGPDAPYSYDAPYYPPADAQLLYPADARVYADAPYVSYDASSSSVDGGYYGGDDGGGGYYGGYDGGYYCYPYYGYYGNPCGTGYVRDQYCGCVACAETCPPGQTPGVGCSACVACPYSCPAGFVDGPGCTCVPRGTDAGIITPPVDAGEAGVGADAGGVTCVLEGYYSCAAGSWCQLGVCPDGKTQYGCYCSPDGKATCDLSCPVPPPCTIPGEGTCPYGAQCVYGSCAADPGGALLVCSCYSSGTAYCSTTSCADGGAWYIDAGAPPADAGVTCLLEGYVSCNAGSYCSLGTCPDGKTPYGCFCNADGTATCDLTCPPAPPCDIPGEGLCPYQTQCVYGTCSGGAGTLLSCYCGYGGSASCYTYPCSEGGVGAD